MNGEKCCRCVFWLNHDAECSDLGECHRYPPRMAVENVGGVFETIRPQDGGWPLTFPDDWCGEFKPMSNNNTTED